MRKVLLPVVVIVSRLLAAGISGVHARLPDGGVLAADADVGAARISILHARLAGVHAAEPLAAPRLAVLHARVTGVHAAEPLAALRLAVLHASEPTTSPARRHVGVYAWHPGVHAWHAGVHAPGSLAAPRLAGLHACLAGLHPQHAPAVSGCVRRRVAGASSAPRTSPVPEEPEPDQLRRPARRHAGVHSQHAAGVRRRVARVPGTLPPPPPVSEEPDQLRPAPPCLVLTVL
ncbi:unnamed protein product, partial [Urochloa humidicola]